MEITMENAYVLQLPDSKFKDLFLCFCGYAQCRPFHNFGPAVRPNYIIHFILDGKGIYQTGEKKFELQAGQGFLIEPETLTFYQADGKEPWSYIWIGFGGTRAEEYVRDLGLNSSRLTFQSSHGNELKNIVRSMMKLKTSAVSSQYRLQGLLYEFFAVLAADAVITEHEAGAKENSYIEHAVNFIRNNYVDNIRITDIADYICVNRSYLYKLFEKNLQMSPQEFLTRFRISRARELLTITTLSIEEIASSCGYRDFRVFSRQFKKLIGQSPTSYRRHTMADTRQKLSSGEKQLEEILQQDTEVIRIGNI